MYDYFVHTCTLDTEYMKLVFHFLWLTVLLMSVVVHTRVIRENVAISTTALFICYGCITLIIFFDLF